MNGKLVNWLQINEMDLTHFCLLSFGAEFSGNYFVFFGVVDWLMDQGVFKEVL
jgi:hypothetical protein